MEPAALFDSIVLAITHLGSGPGVISLALLYAWWVDPAGGRKLGVLLGLSWLLNLSLKQVFSLPRPFDAEVDAASDLARATARGPGFPSGHTQATATFWFFLAGHRRNRWLLAFAFVMVVLVGLSRVWLGVHYPMDILGGLAVGVVLAWLGVRAPEPPRLPLWSAPLWILAGMPLVLAGEDFAAAAGLTVGVLLAPGDHKVPRTRGQRLLVAVGGLVVMWGIYLLAGMAIDGLPALAAGTAMAGETGVPPEAWAGYLRAAVLTLFAFGLWPRWVLGRRAEKAAPEPEKEAEQEAEQPPRQ